MVNDIRCANTSVNITAHIWNLEKLIFLSDKNKQADSATILLPII